MIQQGKITNNSLNKTIVCNKKIVDLSSPLVMGIANLTDDSFYDGGCYNDFERAKARIDELVQQKADIIDIGACSTRPGAKLVSAKEEIERLLKDTYNLR